MPRRKHPRHRHQALAAGKGISGGDIQIFADQVAAGDIINRESVFKGEATYRFMAPDLPQPYVIRREEHNAVISHLLSGEGNNAVAITALRGAGGFGKTALATAVCHDERIREYYHDGVLWISLGYGPLNLVGLIEDLVETIAGRRPQVSVSLEAASTLLADHLEGRRFLLVLDDSWRVSDVSPFMRGGRECARLITTRDSTTVPWPSLRVTIDLMKEVEAIELLSSKLPFNIPLTDPSFQRLSTKVGRYPLLLKLARGELSRLVEDLGLSVTEALEDTSVALEEIGVTALDGQEAVAKTMAVWLRSLESPFLDWYTDLGIFRKGVEIPVRILERLWCRHGSLKPIEAKRFCQRLAQLSLIEYYDPQGPLIRLHDVISDYLRERLGEAAEAAHCELLNSCAGDWCDLPDEETYLWDNLFYHLEQLGRVGDIVKASFDFRYLARKTKLRGTAPVELDLSIASKYDRQGDSLRLARHYADSAHLLAQCESVQEVANTLRARLWRGGRESLKFQHDIEGPSLSATKPLPDLPSRALLRTFVGHKGRVYGCHISPSCRWLLSASDDGTVRVWRINDGSCVKILEGHEDRVFCCSMTPDERYIISAGHDHTVRIWLTESGEQVRILKGHEGAVWSCSLSRDGAVLASAAEDQTIRLWDIYSGKQLMVLEGHLGPVTGCALSSNGSLVTSASGDCTLKVWDTRDGSQVKTLYGHEAAVWSCSLSEDASILVSSSIDGTLRVWDVLSGASTQVLLGHVGPVWGCSVTKDGLQAVSASEDTTARIWDLRTGKEIEQLLGHSRYVWGCSYSADGQLVASSSLDKTVKLWKPLAHDPGS